MKFKDLKILQGNEREEKLNEMYKELMKMRAQAALGATLKSPGKVRSMRKIAARLIMLKGNHGVKASEKARLDKKQESHMIGNKEENKQNV